MVLGERVLVTTPARQEEPAVRLFLGGHLTRIHGEPFSPGTDRMFTAAHPPTNIAPPPAVELFVGAQAAMVRGQRVVMDASTRCMFTAAHPPSKSGLPLLAPRALLDSGAFTDPPHKRLTPEGALERRLCWEEQAAERWGIPWQADGLVSYDLLVDETYVAGQRRKHRWSLADAERAVAVTVEAARYLASQRERLAPRTLILSCQGVDPQQYQECAAAVLQVARPRDWLGLGGWCVLGRWKTLLPSFWQTLYAVLPMARAAGVTHVHIFGVLWEPALAGLLWLADQHGLTVSTDSTAPVLACTWKDAKKAGVRVRDWKGNVRWWVEACSSLRHSPYYRRPPDNRAARQLTLSL